MGRLLRILGLAIASAYFASMLALSSATATIPTPPSPLLATDLTGQTALLNLPMNRSRVGILPAGNKHETGKMPVPPRCPFHLTLQIIPAGNKHETGKMPVPPRCPFHETGKMPVPPRCPFHETGKMPVPPRWPFHLTLQIIPAGNKHETGKMPVPPRWPFHLTLQIIPAGNKHETGKMPVLPRWPFHETGKMPVPPRCPFHETGKMPVPPRCPFHLTLKIIPLLSNTIISAQALESSSNQIAIPVKAEIDAKTQVLFEQLFDGFGAFNILIIFLLTVGPLKLIVPFVKLTANADPALRRQLALRGFGISTLVIFAVALLCQNVLKSWQIDLSAMLIATGIILFLVALRTVLSQYNPPTTKENSPVNPSLKLTINPLVFPSILTPYGIAVVVTMSAMFGRMAIAPGSMFLLLFVVMVLNLGVMLVAHPLLNLIKPVTLRVLGFVFGVMQVALGLDMILTGVKLEAIALKFILGL
ncbi:MAG: MarC family protein [Moorea sp. SIO3I7]|uniref:MarC family protein n=1 Tax=Moorena sp. SIO3I8 TaxID=2607833 RepID=UPI0013C22FDA|nr:MarC family protein [Moorena sp. SIO3I8]NEN94871.1 MarC family protein [Moorena sp. SIO3I7]NEO10264.1 MarC family protein [Moorena sp. SIO3I8]